MNESENSRRDRWGKVLDGGKRRTNLYKKTSFVSFGDGDDRKVDRMYRNTLKKEDGGIVRVPSMNAKGDNCDKVGDSEVANSAANEARKSVESCKVSQTWVRLKTNGIRGVEVPRDGKKAD